MAPTCVGGATYRLLEGGVVKRPAWGTVGLYSSPLGRAGRKPTARQKHRDYARLPGSAHREMLQGRPNLELAPGASLRPF